MWTDDLFKVKKPIIALLHLHALPGDPGCVDSMDEIVRYARADLKALQDGGVDGIMFANEFSMPYQTKADHVTIAAMANIFGQLKEEVTLPYGMNVVLNPMASIELAAATNAQFARSAYTGAYTGEYGVYIPDVAAVRRRLVALGRTDMKLLFKANPESDTFIAQRDLTDVIKSILFSSSPDALCVSGSSAGSKASTSKLDIVREAAKGSGVPVFCNTGCSADNAVEMLDHSDGVCMGTYFKKDGGFRNAVDVERVKRFMDIVNNYRQTH